MEGFVIKAAFSNRIMNKSLILFGAGVGLDLYYSIYKNSQKIVAVLDNDQEKQGRLVADFGQRAWLYTDDFLTVESGSKLQEMDLTDSIVLITAMRNGDAIAHQIEGYGIKNYYRLSDMVDENWRSVLKSGDDLPKMGESFEEWCNRQPIDNERIVFVTFPDFADHGKYIALALRKLRLNVELIFFSDKDYSEKWPGIRFVPKTNWRCQEYLKRTAKIILYNSDISPNTKRCGQIFIETKHWSSVTLKKFFLDAKTFNDDEAYHQRMESGFKQLDYIITGSDFDTRTCRSGFAFNGEVWEIGSPRSDVLFQRDRFYPHIRSVFQLDSSVRIMMYAPTYRFDRNDSHHAHESREIGMNYHAVYDALKNRFGGDWIIMLRLHPTVADASNSMELPDFVVDASDYEDSGELVAACDGMISDYSSLMFEPSFIGLPVFLYATDRGSYAQEYEFLIDYNDLPFSKSENSEELAENIRKFDESEYSYHVRAFLDHYGVREDGQASVRAAKKILNLMGTRPEC